MVDKAVLPVLIINDGYMGSTITSPTIDARWMDNFTFYIQWTGTPVGQLVFNISPNAQLGGPSNVVPNANAFWTTLAPQPRPAVVINGASGNANISLQQLPASFLQLQYIPTSGTGTLSIWYSAKCV